jgi:hypothetical protein
VRGRKGQLTLYMIYYQCSYISLNTKSIQRKFRIVGNKKMFSEKHFSFTSEEIMQKIIDNQVMVTISALCNQTVSVLCILCYEERFHIKIYQSIGKWTKNLTMKLLIFACIELTDNGLPLYYTLKHSLIQVYCIG